MIDFADHRVQAQLAAGAHEIARDILKLFGKRPPVGNFDREVQVLLSIAALRYIEQRIVRDYLRIRPETAIQDPLRVIIAAMGA